MCYRVAKMIWTLGQLRDARISLHELQWLPDGSFVWLMADIINEDTEAW
jgi:hypothetical protein